MLIARTQYDTIAMRAFYFDNIPGDQRLPHDSGIPVSDELLKSIGVLHWHIPASQQDQINAIAEERHCNNRDIVSVTKEGLGDAYEATLKIFYDEHMHEKEEIRYVLEGSGFFDVREHSSDVWIRCYLTAGDLFILPAGIYHRFTLDENDMIKAMRIFWDEPKWIHVHRDSSTDVNPIRVNYLKALGVN